LFEGGTSGKDCFCYRFYLIDAMSVERIDIFGVFGVLIDSVEYIFFEDGDKFKPFEELF
jgi:hypothetical protein